MRCSQLSPLPKEKGAAWEYALTLYQHCSDEGIYRDEVIHGALISAFEKGAQWQGALDVLKVVPASKVCSAAAISVTWRKETLHWEIAPPKN